MLDYKPNETDEAEKLCKSSCASTHTHFKAGFKVRIGIRVGLGVVVVGIGGVGYYAALYPNPRVRGWVIHYIYESPHNDRNTSKCVCV